MEDIPCCADKSVGCKDKSLLDDDDICGDMNDELLLAAYLRANGDVDDVDDDDGEISAGDEGDVDTGGSIMGGSSLLCIDFIREDPYEDAAELCWSVPCDAARETGTGTGTGTGTLVCSVMW